jgi:hypothetical protein
MLISVHLRLSAAVGLSANERPRQHRVHSQAGRPGCRHSRITKRTQFRVAGRDADEGLAAEERRQARVENKRHISVHPRLSAPE